MFEVQVDGDLTWSRKQEECSPETKESRQRARARLGWALAHLDMGHLDS